MYINTIPKIMEDNKGVYHLFDYLEHPQLLLWYYYDILSCVLPIYVYHQNGTIFPQCYDNYSSLLYDHLL